MRIYIIGYMGCGKSTLGRRLACYAEFQFVDMDYYIESRNCKTVPQIFAEEGEEAFRHKERKALEELSEFTNVIIATGGGAPCFYDNIDLMNRTGKTIYLNINPEILAERLIESKNERPLIKGKTKEELVQYIATSLSHREKFYRKAQFQITEPDVDLEKVMKMINEVL